MLVEFWAMLGAAFWCFVVRLMVIHFRKEVDKKAAGRAFLAAFNIIACSAAAALCLFFSFNPGAVFAIEFHKSEARKTETTHLGGGKWEVKTVGP